MRVVLAPSHVLSSPGVGGHAWVYANWSLGLRAHGCRVTWMERFDSDEAPDGAVDKVRALLGHLREVGLDVELALILSEGDRLRLDPVLHELERLTVPFEEAAAEADLLLSFYYALEPDRVARFRRTALVDIDPGLLQSWIHAGDLQVARYDTYFTTGETVGTPRARFPDCGLDWVHVPPPVHLEAWPASPPPREAPYTTVSSWWAEWEVHDGEPYSNEKRTSFLEYVDLPGLAGIPLQLSLSLSPWDEGDRALLERSGWRVAVSEDTCPTPARYRQFVQGSRGEFSCAKPSCMRLANAWISDRTLCYLASGRPAVVQHTGPSRLLPDAEGLLRFRTPEEAARCLQSAEAGYERHSRAARALVEAHFDSVAVVRRVLERAG